MADGERWSTAPDDVEPEIALLAAQLAGLDAAEAISFVCAQKRAGTTPLQIHRAAVCLSVRRHRNEGRGVEGLVAHGILAAHSCIRIGQALAAGPKETRWLPVFQHIAYVCGSYRGGMRDPNHGPYWLADFAPAPSQTCTVKSLWEAIGQQDVDQADHIWLGLAQQDRQTAYEALLRGGLSGYPRNEHKIIFPVQTWLWAADAGWRDEEFRGAVRYAANPLQDDSFPNILAQARDASASVGSDRSADWVTEVAGELVTSCCSATDILSRALAAGLDEGAALEASALASARLYAQAPLTGLAAVGPIHATTGVNAIRHAHNQVKDPILKRDLTLAGFSGRRASELRELATQAEEVHPLYVSDPVSALGAALDRSNVNEARAVAAGIDPDDVVADRCWELLMTRLVWDDVTFLHGIKQVVALQEDFAASTHPHRNIFLQAAARTAAICAGEEQWVAAQSAAEMHAPDNRDVSLR